MLLCPFVGTAVEDHHGCDAAYGKKANIKECIADADRVSQEGSIERKGILYRAYKKSVIQSADRSIDAVT